MADPREILARLYPTTVRFDVGRGGGIPELTNIDIAGALGMVPAGLGREVLEACWCQDGAALRRHKLRDAVLGVVGPEITRQTRKVVEASLDLQLAEAAILWSNRSCNSSSLDQVAICKQRLSDARSQCWPNNTVKRLPLIAKAIIQEMRGFRCQACHGTGRIYGEDISPICSSCAGRGISGIHDCWRAAAIEVDASDYPKRWKRVYEWLFAKMRDAESTAATEFGAAIRRDAA